MFDRIVNAINVNNIEKLAAVCALLRETLRRAGRRFSKGVAFLSAIALAAEECVGV
jgi:hypothetical protein